MFEEDTEQDRVEVFPYMINKSLENLSRVDITKNVIDEALAYCFCFCEEKNSLADNGMLDLSHVPPKPDVLWQPNTGEIHVFLQLKYFLVTYQCRKMSRCSWRFDEVTYHFCVTPASYS